MAPQANGAACIRLDVFHVLLCVRFAQVRRAIEEPCNTDVMVDAPISRVNRFTHNNDSALALP